MGEGLQQFLCTVHNAGEGHCGRGCGDRLPAVHPEDSAVLVAGGGDGGCHFESGFQSVPTDGSGTPVAAGRRAGEGAGDAAAVD